MGNRIIKESVHTSATIAKLTDWGAEVLFYRLLVACDDYGRFDGRAEVVLGRCYPLAMGRVTTADVERWLVELERVDLVRRYDTPRGHCLAMRKWDNHQRIRNKHSRYPAPSDSNLAESADNCGQLTAIDNNCGLNLNLNLNGNLNENRGVAPANADAARGLEAPKTKDGPEVLSMVRWFYNARESVTGTKSTKYDGSGRFSVPDRNAARKLTKMSAEQCNDATRRIGRALKGEFLGKLPDTLAAAVAALDSYIDGNRKGAKPGASRQSNDSARRANAADCAKPKIRQHGPDYRCGGMPASDPTCQACEILRR